jgi:hypothetical protein
MNNLWKGKGETSRDDSQSHVECCIGLITCSTSFHELEFNMEAFKRELYL